MKKNILLLLTALLSLVKVGVQAEEESFCCSDERNFYAKILSGVNFLQSTNNATYKTGYIVSASLGYYYCYGLRLEAEYAFRRNAIRKIHFFGEGSSHHGHFQTSSCMANLLWDLPLSFCECWNIQPFIGAGIGYDFQQEHSSNSRVDFHQKWNHFAWQLIAGFAYPIFCNTDITLEYKFHQGGCHFYNHSLGVGLVYNFGL